MPITTADLVAEAKQHIDQVDIQGAQAIINDNSNIIIIDVREPAEFDQGHLPNAINIPRGVLEFKLDHPSLKDNHAAHFLIYCKVGGRGALATHTLQRLGYTNIVNMDGGFQAWSTQGFSVEKAPSSC